MKRCIECYSAMAPFQDANICWQCKHKEQCTSDPDYRAVVYLASYNNSIAQQEWQDGHVSYGRAARDAEVATQGYW